MSQSGRDGGKVLFITGAGTEVGKTIVAAAILRALRGGGFACDALKPIVSGYDEAAPAGSDPALLLQALGEPTTAEALARVSPWRFAAPLAADAAARAEGKRIAYADVLALCQARTAATPGLLLIEGAGGLMAPVDETHTFLDLISALDAPIILASKSYLGAISHTLTAVEAARARGVAIAAIAFSEDKNDPAATRANADAIARRAHSAPVIGVPWGCQEHAELAEIARQAAR